MKRSTLPIGLILLCLTGCQERTTSKGWASEVPSGSIRYIEQAAPEPAAEKPPEPVATDHATAKPEAAPEPTVAANIKEPTKIVVWHSYRADEKNAFKAVVDAFNALGTQITVTARAVPFDAFNDKIQIVVPRGKGPDLFIFAHDTIGTWAEMDIVEPLNDWVPEDRLDAFLEYTLPPLIYRESLYGLPLAFKTSALIYNKALVKEPPATFEALVAEAKKHTTGERYGLVYESTNLYFHAPWLSAFGGVVLDDKDQPQLNSEGAIKALALARSLVKEHKVTPQSVSAALVSGYFNDGKAAMVINGPWMRGEIEGVDYGVAPLPTVNGQPARPFLGVEALYLNKQSAQKEAAMEVARFLVSDASAQIRFEKGKQPVANKSIWDSGAPDASMQGFQAQARRSMMMPSSPRMQQIWGPYNTALLSVIAGDATPAKALGEAQADVERALARNGE
ncbi:MAG: arabinogalactan oligomer/maltooligosaccharide transport system substrate-binding protein [Myxococcota bacterium]|jgi:arabinogalactan oligomer/maltooligosaccharide transport system substrate-binding protein